MSGIQHTPVRAILALSMLSAVAVEAQPVSPQRGPELLMPFKQGLQAALRDGLSAGPDAAVAVCRDRAPALAREHSSADVRMGRTSHRLRNPSNVAPEWVAPILARYAAGTMPTEQGRAAGVAVALENGREGYVEPILLQPQCLACHGDSLAPEVADTLEKLYPQDTATGFAVGDFRGLFWVEYSAKTALQ